MQCTLRGALENRFSQYVPLKDESDALAGLVKGLAATSTGDCRDLHPSLRGLLAGVGCLDSTHVVVDCLRLGKCSWGSLPPAQHGEGGWQCQGATGGRDQGGCLGAWRAWDRGSRKRLQDSLPVQLRAPCPTAWRL